MFCSQYYEGTRAAWLAQKSGQIYKHTYDVGVYRNLTMVPSLLFIFPRHTSLKICVLGCVVCIDEVVSSNVPMQMHIYLCILITHLCSGQILGPSMLRWPLPSAMGHVKDGTSFPTVRDSL